MVYEESQAARGVSPHGAGKNRKGLLWGSPWAVPRFLGKPSGSVLRVLGLPLETFCSSKTWKHPPSTSDWSILPSLALPPLCRLA